MGDAVPDQEPEHAVGVEGDPAGGPPALEEPGEPQVAVEVGVHDGRAQLHARPAVALADPPQGRGLDDRRPRLRPPGPVAPRALGGGVRHGAGDARALGLVDVAEAPHRPGHVLAPPVAAALHDREAGAPVLLPGLPEVHVRPLTCGNTFPRYTMHRYAPCRKVMESRQRKRPLSGANHRNPIQLCYAAKLGKGTQLEWGARGQAEKFEVSEMFARIMLWVIFAAFAAMTVAFLSGHGASLIAGYNTATEAERETVDEKKLLRVMGGGMLVATLVIFVLALLGERVPTAFVYVTIVIIGVDCAAMGYLANTRCKK